MSEKREELVALADEFDDIAVDADGKCYWCDVANAQTHLRAQLHRFAAQASAAPPERVADRTTLNSIPEDGFNCIFLYENGREVGCLNGPQNDPDVIARAEHWCRLSSRDDGEAESSDEGVCRSLPSGESEPVVTQAYPSAEAPSTIPADVLAMKEACKRLQAERMRQIGVEGWDSAHDDAHSDGQLLLAGMCYLSLARSDISYRSDGAPMGWPWDRSWWKPKDDIRNLERAGALFMAERDRLKRAGQYFGHVEAKLALATRLLAAAIRSALAILSALPVAPVVDEAGIRADEREKCARIAESPVRQEEWPRSVGLERTSPTYLMQQTIAQAIRAGGGER